MRVARTSLCICFMMVSFYLMASVPMVRNTTRGIEFCNDIVSFTITNNAELLSCIEIQSGLDIAAHDNARIAKAKTVNGQIVEATRVVLSGSTLHITIGHEIIDVEVRAFDDYFTFEVLSDNTSFSQLTFLDLKMKYDTSEANYFLASGVAMSIQTDQVYFPSGESMELIGRCSSRIGIKGAKLGATLCRKDALRSILQKIYSTIPAGSIPVSPLGGPFAVDSELNRVSGMIIGSVEPSQIPDWISFCNRWDIKLLDILKGEKTFIQGDFSFPSYESASTFKEKITTPLREAGIFSLMHTYSFYISYESKEILSTPKWQEQLEFRDSFLLSKSITASSTTIDVSGDKKALKDEAPFWSVRSPFVLIDNELIKFQIENGRFVSCLRGQCGTEASSHRVGAKVRIVGGRLSHIAPQPGSELFYEIARRTAKAYNEGGFGGFYFDAIAGLASHLEYSGLKNELWYYGASFINEVLKNCKDNPVVEYSTLYPSLWAARGRGGAWDVPYRSYKDWIDDHTSANQVLISRMYVPTIGWYDFYPRDKHYPLGYSTKFMFFDDVDYLGTKVIAYDQTMVYNGFKKNDLEKVPALQRNMEAYSVYNRLRMERYFSDRVKSVLREGEYEYKLKRKNGRWGFESRVYNRRKLRDITLFQLDGVNPFKRQKPFIRLENLYSSDYTDSIPLISFDIQKDITTQKLDRTFSKPINLKEHLALCVSIRGNGKDSRDAICIRLRSGQTSGYADYVIRTNFDGWQVIILSDLDNAENPDLHFNGMEDEYIKMHRATTDFTNITSLQVFIAGECSGVRIKDIIAVPRMSNTLLNPVIFLNNASITFPDAICSGEYIEYSVGDKNAVIYDSLGNAREVTPIRDGRFRVPKGPFVMTVSGDTDLKNTPAQVVLTVGLKGSFIRN